MQNKGGQVDQMPQRQTVTKPEESLQIMPGDNVNQMQGELHGNKFYPISLKKVRGQKHPWEMCYFRHTNKQTLDTWNIYLLTGYEMLY